MTYYRVVELVSFFSSLNLEGEKRAAASCILVLHIAVCLCPRLPPAEDAERMDTCLARTRSEALGEFRSVV